MRSYHLYKLFILSIILLSCSKDYSIIQNSLTGPTENIRPFVDPLPDSFFKQNYSIFQWEKLDIVIDSNNPRIILGKKDHLFAITNDIYRSNDHGLNWEKIDPSSYGSHQTFAGSIDNTDTLFILSTKNLLMSGDYGNTWILKNKPDLGSAVLKTYSNAIVFGGFNFIYRSIDYGNNWNPQFEYYGMPLTTLLINENFIFAGTEIDGTLLSNNAGIDWKVINDGFPKSGSGFSGRISDIERDPISGEIYVSREQSIYKFDSLQNKWIKIYDVDTRIESFSFDQNGNLYVAGNMGVGLGMFFKGFNEDTFRSTNSGNEEIAYIKDIVINSSGRPFIISKEGLFRLKD